MVTPTDNNYSILRWQARRPNAELYTGKKGRFTGPFDKYSRQVE